MLLSKFGSTALKLLLNGLAARAGARTLNHKAEVEPAIAQFWTSNPLFRDDQVKWNALTPTQRQSFIQNGLVVGNTVRQPEKTKAGLKPSSPTLVRTSNPLFFDNKKNNDKNNPKNNAKSSQRLKDASEQEARDYLGVCFRKGLCAKLLSESAVTKLSSR
jgi:hypothetical protein